MKLQDGVLASKFVCSLKKKTTDAKKKQKNPVKRVDDVYLYRRKEENKSPLII